MASIFEVVPGNVYIENNTAVFYTLDEAMKYGDEVLAGGKTKYVNVYEWYIGAIMVGYGWGKVSGGEWQRNIA